ncbi:MAG: ribonuclease P [Candidatus Woesearchaeota archaeon]|jgi:ribonuclease P protein subunit RPR2
MSKKNKLSREEARKLVVELLDKAKISFKSNKEKAGNYVKKARNIAMKVRLRMGPDLKHRFCKYCNSYLVPGENLRVRTQKGKLVYFCTTCNNHWRLPFTAEIKAKRKLSLTKDKK